MYWFIIIVLIILAVGIMGLVLWFSSSSEASHFTSPERWGYRIYPYQSNDTVNQVVSDVKIIRDTLITDSHLHRLLMIEIIGEKSDIPSDMELPSEAVTFGKMSNGIETLGKSLVRAFGGAISQKLATLMQQRNEIIRDYYRSMRNIICQNGTCVHIIDVPNSPSDDFIDKDTSASKESTPNTKPKRIIRPAFPGIASKLLPGDSSLLVESLDITTITLRRLETVTREITDNIASSFHIRDVDSTTGKKRPIIHFQRIFNLITMYDKELINQAKAYASKQYDISMNCAQSSLEITYHISDELSVLMTSATN